MIWATIHTICRKSSPGCLPIIVHVDMVSNYFHLSFFPLHSILHAMTQSRYRSDHMWVGAARLGIQDALSYPESHHGMSNPENACGVWQKRLLITSIRMPWMGFRVVQRHNARQMLSLQDARASLLQHEPSGIFTQFITCIYMYARESAGIS